MKTVTTLLAVILLAIAAERVPVVRTRMTLNKRPVLCEYVFGSNGVVYCSAIFRDTFQKAGDSVGTWKIDPKRRVVIRWYNPNNICLPATTEVLRVDLKRKPPQLQIVEHDDKNQVDTVTRCEIESLGGVPGENARKWLSAVIPAIDSTHLSLINPLTKLAPLQRKEMLARLDEVEVEYRKNQKLASEIKDNPLASVLFRVDSDSRTKPEKK
jgi:hypothetical protein